MVSSKICWNLPGESRKHWFVIYPDQFYDNWQCQQHDMRLCDNAWPWFTSTTWQWWTIVDTDAKLFYLLPHQHFPCFNHTLQLIGKNGLKQAAYISEVLDKVSQIVSRIQYSTHATELLQDEAKLEIANVTRWNSQLRMICMVWRINPGTDCKKVDKLMRYNANLIDKLTPFETAMMLTQMSELNKNISSPWKCGKRRDLTWRKYIHLSSLGYERVFQSLCKVADTPFHIQRDGKSKILTVLSACLTKPLDQSARK